MRIFHLEKKMIKTIDWFILIEVVGLCFFSLIAIANAKTQPYFGNDTGILAILASFDPHYVRLQGLWIVIGLMMMIAVMLVDYRFLGEIWFYIYIAGTAILAMVTLLSEGISGVNAWFKFASDAASNTFRTIQPAEFCKIAVIIVMAKLMTRSGAPLTRLRELLLVLGYLAIPMLMVVLQGELGSVMVYFVIFVGMLFLSGTSWKLLVGLFVSGALSLVPLWFLIGKWRQDRILGFLGLIDPSQVMSDVRYQVERSMLAIGSGQMTGKGLFREGSLSQLSYVPVNHSDFIFSVTAEAIGFWGCLILVIAFTVLILRLFWLSAKVQDRFGALLIVGVASMFLFQTFENIAMTMDLMPITGIPLPFISYGGSAMLTNLMCVGIVQNVLMRPTKSYLAS